MATAPLLLITLASVFQSGTTQQEPTPAPTPDRKVRIEIVTTENGETKRVTREFDASDADQMQDVLREMGVMDKMRVDGDGENVTIDIRRFGGDPENGEDMIMSIAPLAPMSPMAPLPPMKAMACEKHAYLGVSTRNLDDELRAELKTDLKEGAYVIEVIDDTPAKKIGLKEGDIITAVDEAKVTGPKDLSEAIKAHEPGDNVKVTYYRNGKKSTATAKLEEHESKAFAYAYRYPGDGEFEFDMEDLEDMHELQALAEPRAFLGVNPADEDAAASAKGAAIGEIEEGTAAEKMGIKEGDVITSVNGTAIADFGALADKIRSMKPGDAVAVVVERKGSQQTLNGTLGETKDFVRSFHFNGEPGMFHFDMEGLPPEARDDLRREMDQLRREMDEMRREMNREMRTEMRVTIESRKLSDEEKQLLAGKGVSMANELTLADLRTFPNPSNGFFRIQFDVPERGDLNVDVHDAAGEKVYQERILGFKGRYERTLDLTDKATGTYFLVITQGGKTTARKLVKE